ncbi:MAG TPA: polysaccharide deacetylase family protein [Candidatus Angelobacter sp.]
MARPFTRSPLRAQGKMFWASLLRVSGMLYLAKKWVQRHGAIVLTFHRVLSSSELRQTASLPGMIVSDGTFSSFLKYATDTCEFIDVMRGPLAPTGKLKLAVTFDDGWSDNAAAAYPAARQHKTPMVIFIVPEKTGTELPFWPERTAAALDSGMSTDGAECDVSYIEHAIEKLKELPAVERGRQISQMTASRTALHSSAAVDRTMTWEQIAELHAGGVRFGSHTSTHEILTVIPVAQAEQEITSSRTQIEKSLSAPCLLFSYPNGDCSEPVRGLVARAGYKFAFLNQCPGVWTRACDPFLIPRVNVCEYHMVDSKGNFSPLIFDYAVVWSAAKGLLAQMLSGSWKNLQRRWQNWLANPEKPSEKKQLEKSS